MIYIVSKLRVGINFCVVDSLLLEVSHGNKWSLEFLDGVIRLVFDLENLLLFDYLVFLRTGNQSPFFHFHQRVKFFIGRFEPFGLRHLAWKIYEPLVSPYYFLHEMKFS